MNGRSCDRSLQHSLSALHTSEVSLLDFLPDGTFTEKIIGLALGRIPDCASRKLSLRFQQIRDQLATADVAGVKLVALGGGTGLSNIIGGDSRRKGWKDVPFTGLKEIFPRIHSIVCVTDDGGSTGELLKDFPLVALGDLRHVLLSSIRRDVLRHTYGVDDETAWEIARQLHGLFNYRFISRPDSPEQLLADTAVDFSDLPDTLIEYLQDLVGRLFHDPRMRETLNRPQCLGNLLLASAVYRQLDSTLDFDRLVAGHQVVRTATCRGLAELASSIGARHMAVIPCTTTIAQLQVLYANGVQVTSETKSATARRGYPVDRVLVEFSREPFLPPEVVQTLSEADVIVLAPGSLYTSIIPILQVPGIAEVIRANSRALKLLISNIWVQKGETDATRDAPNRKFHVSDLIMAYHRNIPGGVSGLFSHVLTIDLGDVPGSILQNYGLEEKEPIYLDRQRVRDLGFEPVEACIYSRDLLQRNRVIQHDPAALAQAVRILWSLKTSDLLEPAPPARKLPPARMFLPLVRDDASIPCKRYETIRTRLKYLSTEYLTSCQVDLKMGLSERDQLLERILEIIWRHADILPEHLRYICGITLVDPSCWRRCQQWDNVFSFYDPYDLRIKIRRDQLADPNHFEVAFLIALGQSLLGNYAEEKYMQDMVVDGENVGRMFCLRMREKQHLKAFLASHELDLYMRLARMRPSRRKSLLYTRLINAGEGFTPPGMLFGLFYAWYLDNRFAAHIEYKMSIMKNEVSDLIPEQIRIVSRRERLIRFFREIVFRQRLPESAPA